ncbi:MAG: hypothetical protein RLZ12_897 [Bacillota bacterium]
MINISIDVDQVGAVRRVTVSGHADFAPKGRDIVCAAVSAVVIGLSNAMEKIFQQNFAQVVDATKIICTIPAGMQAVQQEQALVFFKALCYMLEELADEYSDYVKVSTKRIFSQ